ncbi:uncharacterized protein PODANS_5_3110 [Podospora anserina S mat+]|uniref:Podospora anserina S mat+ genomic DNA chromosome 5, supercontig 1 n=1 Tax=Podospora anserina (strain S / ATCC MYA-4624 / DSM 980 / FGSC 10383) TaxID=515849 RepID=B2AEB8_PODAN|nr:uncharacterized protein PODANS_5_3110 [Podospora anserina S mat+]CAP61784.1 unnamed protein product [Podospora anserina S mat+]CDP28860.1 Putative protein of unknown function [Podospora anserina S mat+]
MFNLESLLLIIVPLSCFLYISFPWRKPRLSFPTWSNASTTGHIAILTDEKPKSPRLERKRQQRMRHFKDLYHKVQNLERFPEILPQVRETLLSLLEQGLRMAKYKDRSRSILNIATFDASRLQSFIQDIQLDVGLEFEAYMRRRELGGGPELFKSFEEACMFLKNSAPWNYTDGAWLARIHQVTTPFAFRGVTKDAWQIFSEELGDGDLGKNHILLYKELLQSVGVDLPNGDSLDFIHPRHGMEDETIWRYAIGQLLISVFPNEFLPEILGFNLHYEQPAIGVLKANKELPEFGISPYYYALHISIDNAHSGHCAMAIGNIAHFMEIVQNTGIMDQQTAWRRVQAGYCLGQSLDDRDTVDDYEDKLVDIICKKATIATKIHCTSRARIGKRKLSSWFSAPPSSPKDDDGWKDEFLDALADSKPWVCRGDSSKSLLMRELGWKGRMFGAFTHVETELLRNWIDSLRPHGKDMGEAYWGRVGGYQSLEKTFDPSRHDAAVSHPTFPATRTWSLCEMNDFEPKSPIQIHKSAVEIDALLPLWFAHAGLLENIISSPHQTITPLVSNCLQILRAEKGYKPVGTGIACMDEQHWPGYSPDLVALGLEMMKNRGLPQPTCLGDIIGRPEDENLNDSGRFSHDLLGWAQHPMINSVFLLGLARAFLDLEQWVADNGELLGRRERLCLSEMIQRKATGFETCWAELKRDGLRCCEFVTGYDLGRAEIHRLLVLG